MKSHNLLFAVLTAIFVGMLSSCSKRSEILDSVPPDVTMVATVNIDKMCSAVGVTLKDDGTAEIAAPAQRWMNGVQKELNTLATLKSQGVFDIENMVIALDGDVKYCIMSIDDEDKVMEATRDNIGWNDATDGYRIGRMDGSTFLMKDGLLWIVSGSRDAVKSVSDMNKRAREMSVGKLDGVAAAMTRDNMANIAVASGFASLTTSGKSDTEIPAQDKEWNVASLQQGADGSLVLDWQLMQSTGRTLQPKGLQPVNPALLAYVPENFNVVAAAGLTGEFDWEPLRKIVMMVGGFQTAAFMSVVNPYLESIDGTMLLAFAPSDPAMLAEGDASDWDFIAMIHMPQAKINALTDMIKNMFATAGMTPTVTPQGLIAVPQYGKTMYIGNVDGYLGISTIGFDNTRNNSLAPTFVNKDMAACVSLRPLSDFLPTAPKGTDLLLSMGMDNGKGEIKLQAGGTQLPVLLFLMDAIR